MLLGIFAHPDDELFAAALLASEARAGRAVTVVCATRGEAGRSWIDIDEPLADRRSAELVASCEALGLGEPACLDLPDGELAGRADDLEYAIRDQLAQLQPTAVVTTGADGIYGHPDHIAVTRAVERVADCELLRAAFPVGLFEPLRAALAKLPGLELARTRLGIDRAAVDRVVDVAPVAHAKRRAIACHRSQLRGGQFLSRQITEHITRVEWYTRS